MPASPNDPRTKRRLAAGDDVNKMSIKPMPNPGLPQGQGNIENYPAVDVDGQMGQLMGKGGAQYPYGDGMLDGVDQQKLGNIGFVENSGQPQHIVPGRGQNMRAPYGTQMQPDTQSMAMMEPQYDMASAMGKTMPGGINNGQPVSYNVTALGPTGGSAPNPGNIPQMDYQMPDSLPLGGDNMGMSTGRGGGRNKGKN